jgi:predicted nucleotidyltransferase
MADQIVNIEKIFSQHPGVIAAWFFGSAQQGHPAPGSDLDIGVFFVAKPTLAELANLRGDLQQGLQIDEIDLVALNGASSILRFEAISGRPV